MPSHHSCILPPKKHSQPSTPQHNAPTTATLNQTYALVALQHVRFRKNKSFQARQVISERCSVHGRLAVAASERMSAHLKRIPALTLLLHHPPSKTFPQRNTATQRFHNRNPQSNLNINSLVALQHVRFQPDKSFQFG